MVHNIQTAVNGGLVLEWEQHPATQQTGTHGRAGPVYHIQQGCAVLAVGTGKFQITYGELVQTHVTLLIYHTDG